MIKIVLEICLRKNCERDERKIYKMLKTCSLDKKDRVKKSVGAKQCGNNFYN